MQISICRPAAKSPSLCSLTLINKSSNYSINALIPSILLSDLCSCKCSSRSDRALSAEATTTSQRNNSRLILVLQYTNILESTPQRVYPDFDHGCFYQSNVSHYFYDLMCLLTVRCDSSTTCRVWCI
jgi:hypothetical protein